MSESGRRTRQKVRNMPPAFENVKNQLAYCGLWCGSCLVGNGAVNERARMCKKALIDYGVKEWGPKQVDYEGLLEGLAAIGSTEPCCGCLKGGGRTDCEIRACATEKGATECVDCRLHEKCRNGKIINHMRSGALGVGMKVKDKKGDRAMMIRQWIDEMDEG